MKYSGSANLLHHYGNLPPSLADASEYGAGEVLRRLSDTFGFYSVGAVMGIDGILQELPRW